jgi:hypothetical protein
MYLIDVHFSEDFACLLIFVPDGNISRKVLVEHVSFTNTLPANLYRG